MGQCTCCRSYNYMSEAQQQEARIREQKEQKDRQELHFLQHNYIVITGADNSGKFTLYKHFQMFSNTVQDPSACNPLSHMSNLYTSSIKDKRYKKTIYALNTQILLINTIMKSIHNLICYALKQNENENDDDNYNDDSSYNYTSQLTEMCPDLIKFNHKPGQYIYDDYLAYLKYEDYDETLETVQPKIDLMKTLISPDGICMKQVKQAVALLQSDIYVRILKKYQHRLRLGCVLNVYKVDELIETIKHMFEFDYQLTVKDYLLMHRSPWNCIEKMSPHDVRWGVIYKEKFEYKGKLIEIFENVEKSDRSQVRPKAASTQFPLTKVFICMIDLCSVIRTSLRYNGKNDEIDESKVYDSDNYNYSNKNNDNFMNYGIIAILSGLYGLLNGWILSNKCRFLILLSKYDVFDKYFLHKGDKYRLDCSRLLEWIPKREDIRLDRIRRGNGIQWPPPTITQIRRLFIERNEKIKNDYMFKDKNNDKTGLLQRDQVVELVKRKIELLYNLSRKYFVSGGNINTDIDVDNDGSLDADAKSDKDSNMINIANNDGNNINISNNINVRGIRNSNSYSIRNDILVCDLLHYETIGKKECDSNQMRRILNENELTKEIPQEVIDIVVQYSERLPFVTFNQIVDHLIGMIDDIDGGIEFDQLKQRNKSSPNPTQGHKSADSAPRNTCTLTTAS